MLFQRSAKNAPAEEPVLGGADFVKHLVPSRSARQNKALDPTAFLGAPGCKHPASPAMLAGQRRDYDLESIISEDTIPINLLYSF